MKLASIEQIMLLLHLPQTGVAAYWRLLEKFYNLRAAFDAPVEELHGLLKDEAIALLRAIGQQGEEHPLIKRIRQDLEWLKERCIHVIDIDSDHYPTLLREVNRAPPILYVWGDPSLLNLPQIALVGSRSPTPGGRANATEFAQGLAETGFTITSGLALGIDVAAHQGALQAGGKTLAILGTGIDQIYPARHMGVAEQIVATGGAVVTEFPLGTKALPSNFPQRNRIISGLSCGVLVVEAAIKSGSLITARYALGQNREVFAIPGSIKNPLSRGCHLLIREGATLVESPDDIVEQLQGLLAFKQSEVAASQMQDQVSRELVSTESKSEQLVMERLGYDPVPFDLIVESTSLPAGELMACLLTMELKGLVANLGHGYARVRS